MSEARPLPVAGGPVPAAGPGRLHAVPDSPRGFVLVVDLVSGPTGLDVRGVVSDLHRRLLELAPAADVQASLIRASGRGPLPRPDQVGPVLRAGGTGRRRMVQRSGPTPVVPDGVVIDLPRKQLCVEGRLASLTFLEYEILEHLVSHAGIAVPRSALLWAVWGPDDGALPSERTVDVHIKRLRAKLGDYAGIVRTVRGSGYRYDPHTDVCVRRHADTSKAPCQR